MKKIDAMRAEIIAATQWADSVKEYGRNLAAKHPEFQQHLRNGASYEDVGQSHLEEQMRVYFAYTLDRDLWQELVEKTEGFTKLDRAGDAPLFSEWDFLHSELVENIGEGLGWTYGSQRRNLEAMEFPTRMRLYVSTMEAFSDAQLVQFGNALEVWSIASSYSERRCGATVSAAITDLTRGSTAGVQEADGHGRRTPDSVLKSSTAHQPSPAKTAPIFGSGQI